MYTRDMPVCKYTYVFVSKVCFVFVFTFAEQ